MEVVEVHHVKGRTKWTPEAKKKWWEQHRQKTRKLYMLFWNVFLEDITPDLKRNRYIKSFSNLGTHLEINLNRVPENSDSFNFIKEWYTYQTDFQFNNLKIIVHNSELAFR